MPNDSQFNDEVVAYFDRHSDSRMEIINDSPFHRFGYSEKKGDVADIVDVYASAGVPQTICDLGCNDGTFLETLTIRHPNASLVGVDVSSKSLEIGKANPRLQDVTFVLSTDETIPLPDESQTIVVLVEVLEHVSDKRRLLEETYRILRPGGVCVITTPNGQCWALRIQDSLIRVLKRVLRAKSVHKDMFIDWPSLQSMGRDIGFDWEGDRPLYWLRPYLSLSYYRLTIGLLLPLFIPVPAAVLLAYQKYLNTKFGRFFTNTPSNRYACWSIFAVGRRQPS